MTFEPAHAFMACAASLEELKNNETTWKAQLAGKTVENSMSFICQAVEANCSSELDNLQEKLRYIRDALAYDPNLHGCKISNGVWYEVMTMAIFWGSLLLLQIVQIVTSRYDEMRVNDTFGRPEPSAFGRRSGQLRVACERLATPWSLPGRILGIFWSLFSVISFAFYLHQTYSHYRFIRFCQNKTDRIYAYIDLGFNIFFSVYYIIRYIASANKASFLFAPHSLMEVCTIGPSICTVFSEDKHTLFNFLRAIRLVAIKEVLISFDIITSATSKSLYSLVIDMFCFWSTLAGLIHLLENLDNFWWGLGSKAFNPCRAMNVFNSFYMLIITASTVGYGDFFPRTTLGQLTVMICIVVAGTYFLTTVPALISIYMENKINKKHKFYTGIGQRHVVLTGTVEYQMLKAFLSEFYLDDRINGKEWTVQVKCCVLHSSTLSDVTQWLLYSLTGRVKSIRGSCVNPRDLMDVKAFSANAVIIISSLMPKDKDEDDYDNYMRAMTVKLNFPDVRTIVQIHSFYNKFSYYYLTGWRSKSLRNSQWDLDTVICNDQIANGLLGLNCVAPGFASLIINLLNSCEAEKPDVFQQYKWRTFYNFGLQAKFHCSRFTRSFRGLTFKAACGVVYDRWGIILLGVSVDQANSHSCTNIINPSCDPNFLINPSIMKAFVIIKNEQDLRRFETYCNYCKNKVDGVCTCDGPATADVIPKAEAVQRSVAEKILREKQMRKNALFTTNKSNWESEMGEMEDLENGDDGIEDSHNTTRDSATSKQPDGIRNFATEIKMSANCKWEELSLMPDSPADLAMEAEFHQTVENGGGGSGGGGGTGGGVALDPPDTWRYERAFRSVADVSGTLHWAPKRPCRLFDIEEANDVPWSHHLLVCVLGQVLSPVGLFALFMPLRNRLIELEKLRDIVILGDADGLAEFEWRHICNFRQVYLVRGSGLFTNHLVCCRVHEASAVAVMRVGPPPKHPSGTSVGEGNGLKATEDAGEDTHRGQEAVGLADTDVVVCAENVRAVVIGRKGERHYRDNFHLTVRLSSPNAASFFSDLKERDKDIQRSEVTATQAFAEGLVISDTQLAALVSATFHCPEVALFIQALIQGSNQVAVENFLGSHVGVPSEMAKEKASKLSPSYPFRIAQLMIREAPLCGLFDAFNSSTIYWEELYIKALENFGVICLGLYQLRNKSRLVFKEKNPSGRFVYTFPSRRTIVDASDKVFCIIPGGNCTAQPNGKARRRGSKSRRDFGKKVEMKELKTGGTDLDNKKLNEKYFSGDQLDTTMDGSPGHNCEVLESPGARLRAADAESRSIKFTFSSDTNHDDSSSCDSQSEDN